MSTKKGPPIGLGTVAIALFGIESALARSAAAHERNASVLEGRLALDQLEYDRKGRVLDLLDRDVNPDEFPDPALDRVNEGDDQMLEVLHKIGADLGILEHTEKELLNRYREVGSAIVRESRFRVLHANLANAIHELEAVLDCDPAV